MSRALTDDDLHEREAISHLAARRAVKHASAVIASVQDGLVAVDEKGRICDVNAELCTMTGFGRGQLIGKRRYPFWSSGDARANAKAIRTALATSDGDRSRVDLWLTHRDGRRFAVRMAVSPIYCAEEVAAGYVGTLRSLDEPKPEADVNRIPAGRGAASMAMTAAIAGVAEAVRADEPSRNTLTRIAAQAGRLIGADVCQIVRLDDGTPSLRAAWSAPALPSPGRSLIADDRIIAAVTGGNGFRWDRRTGETDGSGFTDLETVIAEPLVPGSTPWGMVVLATAGSTGCLDAAARERLQEFVAATALAIASVDVRSAAESRTTRDPLTRLPNRIAFDAHLRREVSRAHRHGHDLSLVVVDLDHLRRINGERGVEAGDRALEAVGAALSTLGRSSDIVARVGGDSFAWILPETSSHAAVAAAERARSLIASLDAANAGAVSVSAGISDLRHAGGEEAVLIRQAVRALRMAKQQGRDRSVRYPDVAASRPLDARIAGHRRRGQSIAGLRMLAKAIDDRVGKGPDISITGAELVEQLARELGWSEQQASPLYEAALVRDIGMILMPGEAGFRHERLTATERQHIRSHAMTSARMVAGILTDEQAAWIAQHHDRYDGMGNHGGRRGDAISEGARIIAVVDFWLDRCETTAQAMRRPSQEAIEELRGEAGWALWPRGVEGLIRMLAPAARAGSRSAPGPSFTRLPAPSTAGGRVCDDREFLNAAAAALPVAHSPV